MILAYPTDATLSSLIQVQSMLTEASPFRLDGEYIADLKSLNLRGFRRELAGAKILGFYRATDKRHLMLNHTAFGVYAQLLSPSHAERSVLIVSGNKGSITPFELAGAVWSSQHVYPGRRFCPACLEEDIAHFGVGYWRVAHSLPCLQHCTVHRQKLIVSCQGDGCDQGACGMQGLWPGDICACSAGQDRPVHSDPEFGAPSPGYWKLLDFISLLPKGVVGSYAPYLRMRLLSRLGSTSSQLLDQLLEDWQCEDLTELGSALGCSIKGSLCCRIKESHSVHSALLLALCATARFSPLQDSEENYHRLAAFTLDELYELMPYGIKSLAGPTTPAATRWMDDAFPLGGDYEWRWNAAVDAATQCELSPAKLRERYPFFYFWLKQYHTSWFFKNMRRPLAQYVEELN